MCDVVNERTKEEILKALILTQNKFAALRADNKRLLAENAELKLRLQLIAGCATGKPLMSRRPELKVVRNDGAAS